MGRKAMKPEISVSELIGDSGWTSTKMLRKETLIRKRVAFASRAQNLTQKSDTQNKT